MELVKHETCQEYFRRRLSEGWKCIRREGYKVVLLSPDGIRRELDLRNDVETLRPNAAGDETNLQMFGDDANWKCVDEVVADDNTSHVTGGYIPYRRDLYNLPASSGSGSINKITLYFRVKSKYADVSTKGAIKSDSTVTETAAKNPYSEYGSDVWHTYSQEWATNPADAGAWAWADIDALQIGISLQGSGPSNITFCTQVYVEVDYTTVVAPTVTTQAVTDKEDTTGIGNGNITDNGGENCDIRGFVWDLASHGDPGDVSPAVSDYANDVAENNGFGTGAFTGSLTSLPTGDTIYVRAYAHNSGGYSYGGEVSFLTKPAAPTNVAATDGDHTDKVVVTWTKSTGATGYQVYRDGTPLGWLGDVATYDDTGASAPTITPGAASASDGEYADKVALSLSGQSTNNGTTHTYVVRARNATGESLDSGKLIGLPDDTTSYACNKLHDYLVLDRFIADKSGTVHYIRIRFGGSGNVKVAIYADDGGEPAALLNYVFTRSVVSGWNTITIANTSIVEGTAYWLAAIWSSDNQCQKDTGGTQRYKSRSFSEPFPNPAGTGYSSSDDQMLIAGYSEIATGYRGVGALTYQWQRSAADSDASYSNIPGATTASYDDTGAPADGSGRYYRCVENATGAAQQISAVDRGYRITWPTVTTQDATGIGFD